MSISSAHGGGIVCGQRLLGVHGGGQVEGVGCQRIREHIRLGTSSGVVRSGVHVHLMLGGGR